MGESSTTWAVGVRYRHSERESYFLRNALMLDFVVQFRKQSFERFVIKFDIEMRICSKQPQPIDLRLVESWNEDSFHA
jgi:hypothetical protein